MLRMIKLTIAGFACALTLAAGNAFAHGAGGHGGTYHAEEVLDLAPRYVVSLVEKKHTIDGEVLDESWIEVANENKAMDREGSWYYVVKVPHVAKHKTLYLLISKKGKLYRVDFKGDFKDLAD